MKDLPTPLVTISLEEYECLKAANTNERIESLEFIIDELRKQNRELISQKMSLKVELTVLKLRNQEYRSEFNDQKRWHFWK